MRRGVLAIRSRPPVPSANAAGPCNTRTAANRRAGTAALYRRVRGETRRRSAMIPPMIRPAAPADLDAMVARCAAKRAQYAKYQPVFHRPAADAAAKQRPFLEGRLTEADSRLLVEERDGIAGFIWAKVAPAPPTYDPGGPVVL